jgi:hypothetical protein
VAWRDGSGQLHTAAASPRPDRRPGWYPRQQAEPEPNDVVEGVEDLWGCIIDSMIRRSQQEPGNEDEPTRLNSRNPSPGAMLEGPGAAAPVSSAEATEYLARLAEEFPADQDEDNDA